MPLKLLGQGGFGAAFLARDRYTPTMRRCVVKLFQPSGNLTPQQLQTAQNLFEREAEVLEELGNQHAQIPDLFAFFQLTVPSLQTGKKEQFFYLVQELIDGENLEEEFVKNGKFSESQILEILQQILPVLQFVHEHGSIHRDIKPSNIMRSRSVPAGESRKGSLFLLDFGAVKQVTKVAGSSASSTGIYSMGYAPPEQMSGGQVYPSSDLYALAVTCLTLLTGKPPNELFDTYTNQWNWKTYAQVSPRLANILDRMLLTSPNQRYHSAQEVLAALALPPPAPGVQTTAAVTPANPPPPPISVRPRFSLVEVLGAAAFSGFEGGLIAIALSSLPITPGISMALTVTIVGSLIYAQYRRILEGKDLPILIGISLTIVLIFRNALVPAWMITLFGNPIVGVLFVAGLTAAGAIAVTALFRLIYKLLSLML